MQPDELLEQFDQPDLEELFFYLVERAESGLATAVASTPGESRCNGAPHRPVANDRLVGRWRDAACAGRICL